MAVLGPHLLWLWKFALISQQKASRKAAFPALSAGVELTQIRLVEEVEIKFYLDFNNPSLNVNF